mmetsp:Transcript_2351/g.4021  ORF Transcript_2351/g.4021 Transcript_2351/m.4021 type:complete len:310 (+) Transcript_2351:220-1149(+)
MHSFLLYEVFGRRPDLILPISFLPFLGFRLPFTSFYGEESSASPTSRVAQLRAMVRTDECSFKLFVFLFHRLPLLFLQPFFSLLRVFVQLLDCFWHWCVWIDFPWSFWSISVTELYQLIAGFTQRFPFEMRVFLADFLYQLVGFVRQLMYGEQVPKMLLLGHAIEIEFSKLSPRRIDSFSDFWVSLRAHSPICFLPSFIVNILFQLLSSLHFLYMIFVQSGEEVRIRYHPGLTRLWFHQLLFALVVLHSIFVHMLEKLVNIMIVPYLPQCRLFFLFMHVPQIARLNTVPSNMWQSWANSIEPFHLPHCH